MVTTWEDIMENNWELFHVGLIVGDLDKTLEYYQSLGLVSSFLEFPEEGPRPAFEIHGETRDVPNSSRKGRGKVRITRMGPLPIEMIQPGEGSSNANSEFFDSKGDGIAHIAFFVDDLEMETAKLVEKGVPILLTERVQNRVTMHYFDTRKLGGLVLELKQKGTFGDWSR